MTDEVGDNSAEELKRLIERVERLKEERKAISDDISDVYKEAKANVFDVRTMREMEKLRAMNPAARHEREVLYETYKTALMLD